MGGEVVSAENNCNEHAHIYPFSYGDKTTKSLPGRIVAVIWVMFSAILLAIFTAHVTNVLDRSLVSIDNSDTFGLKV